MGKMEQRRSGGAGKGGAEGRRRDKTKGTKPADNGNATRPAVPITPSQGSVKAVRSRLKGQTEEEEEEEAHFTLTLTPEAVLLLQRRSTQKPTRSCCGGVTEARPNGRQKRPPPAQSRLSPKRGVEEPDIDLRSILKISLLNDRHKYDDVEYEEEQYGLDQRVALKCTEWLRGLECPLTGAGTTAGGVGVWKGSAKNC
ncbi:proline-rich protein 18 [Boleophthalmus pectinirostris]|uniref:proline-rich protein 18 n=1 Tax=Boleophthalmus pectinirostris TaxID=150288 RepID=UPI00242D2097|nr:proline-rich protein 18 [Boleophthalmus pectinirostris]